MADSFLLLVEAARGGSAESFHDWRISTSLEIAARECRNFLHCMYGLRIAQLLHYLRFSGDENSTIPTCNALLTLTATVWRRNLSHEIKTTLRSGTEERLNEMIDYVER